MNLKPEHIQTIRSHAESTYPEECCGLILGYIDNQTKTVVEIIPTENAWSAESANFALDDSKYSEARRYAIAPQVMLQVQKAARDKSLNIIGIYHSHPDNSAIPSECDRQYAWPEYSYIIVSVQNGKASELLSWSLDDNHQFQSESIDTINLTT
ncbi:M67 family metallopeptidase [Nostoc sp. FACHB-152]|uniref:Mov34/MPN/PAD-1 family protein n=1 Tax=unclassified Nostoc TaxID=2593658 RepID=UPI001684EA65|nr:MULTISPECIES: M67 family metallopeptidase [unclassified Nostoc]MBD2446472.1 M67 family metallopeptidase [Nostoc sp. FACHB-152]MBD2469572.1 M67 family metallopeptidase [Nostoc sp. FACHB-145]